MGSRSLGMNVFEAAMTRMRELYARGDRIVVSFSAGKDSGVWRDELSVELASFQLWASVHGLCSLLNNGRFDENHPAFPIPDEKSLIDVFVDGCIRSFIK